MPPAAESALPPRVLIVEHEQEIRDQAATALKAAGYETEVAADGAQALTLFARDWYPVVVTARDMPVLDGIEFVSKLRAIALAPVYVIMLTASNDVQDQERSYCAGVDQSIAKQNYQNELVPKVKAGMTAVKRRRASTTGRTNEPVTVDLENGAHTARHLVGRLHAEIAQVSRAQSALHVLSVGLDAGGPSAAKRRVDAPSSAALLTAVYSAIRPKLDWVARLPAPANTCRLAVVMPESDLNDIAAVEQGIRNALVHYGAQSAALRGVDVSVGVARLTAEDSVPTALEFLGQSERNRRSKEVPPAAAKAAAEQPALAPPEPAE
jgi:DNA-binding response OmpR family regulator